MISQSRRAFLKTCAGAAGTCLVGESGFAAAWSEAAHSPPVESLLPFPLNAVRLTSGIFQEQESHSKAAPRDHALARMGGTGVSGVSGGRRQSHLVSCS